MGFGDKGVELTKKVSDNVDNMQILDEKKVLEQTKHDLLQLKDDVRYAEKVSDELAKGGWIDNILATERKRKLHAPEQREKQEAVNQIAEKVEEVRTQFDTLSDDKKEKVKKMTVVLQQIRAELFGLQQQIVDTKALEQKTIEAATKELDKHRYSRLLVGPYTKYIQRRFASLKQTNKQTDLSIIDTVKQAFTDFYYQAIGVIGGRFAGKSVAGMVDGISLDAIKQKGAELLQQVDQVSIDDLSPEALQQGQTIMKRKIDSFVQKQFGKKLTPEQLDRIAKKLDTKDLLRENKTLLDFLSSGGKEGADANLFHAGVEGLVLPLSMMTQLISALKEEGVIDTKEIVFNVTGDVIEYGLKGFKLFGSGLALVLGKVSRDEVGGQMARLYDKSPDEAKQLLFALIYRGQHSPIFKLMLNTGEWLAKLPMFFLADMNDSVKSLGHIKDVYKGNIDTAIKQLEKISDVLPANFGGKDLQDTVKAAKASVKQMSSVNDMVTILHNMDETVSVSEFKKKLTRNGIQIADLPPNIANELKNATGDLSNQQLRKMLSRDILDITKQTKNVFGQNSSLSKFFGKTKGLLKGEANPYKMIDDMSRYLDDVGQEWSKMVHHGSWFTKQKAKLKLSNRLMNETLESGKFMYHFDNVTDFEDFVKKSKFLMKSSPSSLKFLVGKSPIFIVGGLAVGEGDTMSEKMKSLLTGLQGLVPLVGPYLIMSDAGIMKDGGPDMGQLALGGVLMGVDGYTLVRRMMRKDFVGMAKYMAQPIVDVWQIGKFLVNAGRRGLVLGKGFATLMQNQGRLNTLKGIGKRLMTKSRLSRVGILTAVAIGGYVSWDYLFSSNDLDKETKDKLAEYKDNPDKLDQEIQQKWPTMTQDERNDYLRAAVLRQGGFSPEYLDDLEIEFANNQYTVYLPSVIARDEAIYVKDLLSQGISRLQSGSSVDVRFAGPARYRFTKELTDQFADISENDRRAKMEEYVRTMGYTDPNIALTNNA